MAEAQAKYTEAWAELKGQVKEAEDAGKPIHAQLRSMAGNAITRELDEAWEEADKRFAKE